MDFSFNNIKITSVSTVVPKNEIDNLNGIDESGERLINVTGIKRKRSLVGTGFNLVDLAVESAKKAISHSGIALNSIRTILYITGDPEFAGPSTAFLVQKELGIPVSCIAFDMNLGCSGFIAGLQTAASLLNSTMEDNVNALVINAEYLTYQKRKVINDAILFGDAAVTTVINKSINNNERLIGCYYSDGERYRTLYRKTYDGLSEMDGDAVFKFAITDVPKTMISFMEKNSISDEIVDFIAIHQAQKFIVDRLVMKAKVNKSKVLYSLDSFGNTGGTSIPLSICRNVEKLNDDNRILACGYGVGLSWGCSYFLLNKNAVLPLSEL